MKSTRSIDAENQRQAMGIGDDIEACMSTSGIKTEMTVMDGQTDRQTREFKVNGHLKKSESDTQASMQSVNLSFLGLGFQDKPSESLYQDYAQRVQNDNLFVLVMMSMSFETYGILRSAISFHQSSVVCLIILPLGFCINMSLVLFLRWKSPSLQVFTALTYTTWILLAVQIYIELGFNSTRVTPMDSLGWHLFLCYSAFTLATSKLYYSALLSLLACMIHTSLITVIPGTRSYGFVFSIQNTAGANILLHACVFLLGFLAFYFKDKSLRHSFQETKESITVNLDMEESSREQERLLLSVLPRHVAEEMIKDQGIEIGGQFRKIYMNRHENVSILFADIVGFTEMSSKVTPTELVKILNDLFANFDLLAKKFHQLRIKILGDCYYSISGCPTARSDHAVLCIHTGLAMVDAISEVREKTKSGVNMRVGIHTGAVLGGVLGQNRWQYDVLGKEVTLANKMESGGLPGRVHISQATVQFLNGEFELENGEGDTREDAIKMAGMKTYLIQSVVKPYPEGTLDANNGIISKIDVNDKINSEKDRRHDDVMKDMNGKLRVALVEREDKTLMSEKLQSLSLKFKDVDLETQYKSRHTNQLGYATLAWCIILIMCFFAQLCVLPKNLYSYLSFAIGGVLLILMTLLSLASSIAKFQLTVFGEFATAIDKRTILRVVWLLLASVILTASILIDIIGCDSTKTSFEPRKALLVASSSLCEYPTYFTDFGVLILLGMTLPLERTFPFKIIRMVVITVIYCIINTVLWTNPFDRYHKFVYSDPNLTAQISTKYSVSASLIFITLALMPFCRNSDRLFRKLFFYRHELDEKRERTNILRQKNESLIYNILPTHVAKDFIGAQKRNDELYSQTYNEVGVMFAACPNFNDFYTEDTVNNNGLECIRVLNEILSDYDDLLKEPRFQSITKIKTIGPTYMAASGMNMDKKIPQDAPVTERWRHLMDLVEFAFALRETLEKINTQSFNNFMLRIGVNHGSVLAGVIGTRKPHYDIWGNSVNVSSRMESTGQLGKIQVVEETMQILKEFGCTFEQRGLVKVKGKGNLVTYFLTGIEPEIHLPNQTTP